MSDFEKTEINLGTTKVKRDYQSTVINYAKYLYLIAFFGLLSAIIEPLIHQRGQMANGFGIMVLFLGMTGGIMLHKAATSEKRRGVYLIVGFGLMALSANWILTLTGRW